GPCFLSLQGYGRSRSHHWVGSLAGRPFYWVGRQVLAGAVLSAIPVSLSLIVLKSFGTGMPLDLWSVGLSCVLAYSCTQVAGMVLPVESEDVGSALGSVTLLGVLFGGTSLVLSRLNSVPMQLAGLLCTMALLVIAFAVVVRGRG